MRNPTTPLRTTSVGFLRPCNRRATEPDLRVNQQSIAPLVIAPAYNAGKHLPELISRVSKAYSLKDFLIIDDGSSDNTQEILKSSRVNYIRHKTNRGKGVALQSGYIWARKHGYDAVISIDSDLQHAPEELSEMLRVYKESRPGVVIGSRFCVRNSFVKNTGVKEREMPLERLITNNLTSLIISIFSDRKVRDSQSGFRLVTLPALSRLRVKSLGYMFESESLLQMGAMGIKMEESSISVIYEDSVSYINPFKDTLRFLRLIWRRFWY